MAEPGLGRGPSVYLPQLRPSVDPDLDEHVQGEPPDDFVLASTHAVLLPCCLALVMHPGNPLGTRHVASEPRVHPKPRGPRHMLMDGNLPPLGTKVRRLGASHDRRNPHGRNPISTTSQRKQIIRKAAESDRVDKRSTWLGLREKRPTFAALERRGCGEIGRHARLRIWCFGVGVRVPPPAHFQETIRQPEFPP